MVARAGEQDLAGGDLAVARGPVLDLEGEGFLEKADGLIVLVGVFVESPQFLEGVGVLDGVGAVAAFDGFEIVDRVGDAFFGLAQLAVDPSEPASVDLGGEVVVAEDADGRVVGLFDQVGGILAGVILCEGFAVEHHGVDHGGVLGRVVGLCDLVEALRGPELIGGVLAESLTHAERHECLIEVGGVDVGG